MELTHPLTREFPEHRETIHRLRTSDEAFRRMFEEYHQVDEAVYRIEGEIDFSTDQELEELKMRRTKLKDGLYHALTHAQRPR